MQFFYHGFGQFVVCMVNDVINASEVVGCFHDVVYVDGFICDSDSVGFKDVSCLFVSEFAALNMVRVVCEVDLCAVIDTSAEFCFFFFV